VYSGSGAWQLEFIFLYKKGGFAFCLKHARKKGNGGALVGCWVSFPRDPFRALAIVHSLARK
jgi:hypothetical protein